MHHYFYFLNNRHNYLDNNWYKADFSNTNPSHKWYDYGEEAHEWANAIVVSDNTRDYYLNSRVGTRINNVDILAFFVWIPRYKYHLWNSSRKVSADYDYSYNAYKFGIDVKFENGTSSTGNINCSYNSVIDEGDNNLSDVCSFQGNVLSNSDNGSSDYWYTHPAFSSDLTGFWMGKFETGGNFTDPTILPDTISIRNINVSNQFKVMKNFDKYISSDDLSAGMVSNLVRWNSLL